MSVRLPRRLLPTLAAMLGLLALGGCAETGFLAELAKLFGGDRATADARFVVGEPYQVGNAWYRPQEDYALEETGLAAWFGTEARGQRTANNELADPDRLTAQHHTLQLPAIVRVTNLDNGRSIVLRVNDRGPPRPDRVIAVSRRAAELLGFAGQDAARVRLQVLTEESRALADRLRGAREVPIPIASAPRAAVASESLAPPPGARTAPAARAPDPLPAPRRPVEIAAAPPAAALPPDRLPERVEQGRAEPSVLFVQAGAFANRANAARLQTRLRPYGRALVQPVSVEGRLLWRVRLGPAGSEREAEVLLGRLHAAGMSEARIVVDTPGR